MGHLSSRKLEATLKLLGRQTRGAFCSQYTTFFQKFNKSIIITWLLLLSPLFCILNSDYTVWDRIWSLQNLSDMSQKTSKIRCNLKAAEQQRGIKPHVNILRYAKYQVFSDKHWNNIFPLASIANCSCLHNKFL